MLWSLPQRPFIVLPLPRFMILEVTETSKAIVDGCTTIYNIFITTTTITIIILLYVFYKLWYDGTKSFMFSERKPLHEAVAYP